MNEVKRRNYLELKEQALSRKATSNQSVIDDVKNNNVEFSCTSYIILFQIHFDYLKVLDTLRKFIPVVFVHT